MLGCKQRRGIKELLLLLAVAAVLVPSACFSSSIINAKDDGYRGIWYMNQSTGDEYVYKYSVLAMTKVALLDLVNEY